MKLQKPQRQTTHLYWVLSETLKISLLRRTWSYKDRIYIWTFREQRFAENFWLKEKTSWDSFMRSHRELD